MAETGYSATQAVTAKAPWGDLLREGRAPLVALVVLGALLHALNILIIAIVMPTVVADVGGADYYTWAAMIYTVASIVGAASVGPVWGALGRRHGSALSGVALLVGTVGSALAPDMGMLIVARAVQGFAAGLVIGGTMAMVGTLFGPALRTRVLAMYQATWMVAQLLSPMVGGLFAELGWWRGSFWCTVPVILCFLAIAWVKLPGRGAEGDAGTDIQPLPFPRLAMLSAGVLCVALAGPVSGTAPRVALLVCAAAMLWYTFRLDRAADNRLFPSRTLSLSSPVGLALWILFVTGVGQTTVVLFSPLLLQVVLGVRPLFVSFVILAVTAGWTVGTFTVSGWTGARERFALWIGPPLMLAGIVGIAAAALVPDLVALHAAAFVVGLGIGTHNVHLLARTMAAADAGEERVTAAALPSIRALGSAFGAALAGMLSTMAGLGDATDPQAVGGAVALVYLVNIVPIAFAVAFMFRLLRLGRGAAAVAAS